MDVVDKILSQRIEAKKAGDYGTADVLRDELRKIDVEVMDRERQWWLIGGGGKSPWGAHSHDYRREADDRYDVDAHAINMILAERLQARMTRDFHKADSLRDKLRSMGVEVDDKHKSWKAVRDSFKRGRSMSDSDDRLPKKAERSYSRSRSPSPKKARRSYSRSRSPSPKAEETSKDAEGSPPRD